MGTWSLWALAFSDQANGLLRCSLFVFGEFSEGFVDCLLESSAWSLQDVLGDLRVCTHPNALVFR